MSLEWNGIPYLLPREHICGLDDQHVEPLRPPIFDQGCQFRAECRRGYDQPLSRLVGGAPVERLDTQPAALGNIFDGLSISVFRVRKVEGSDRSINRPDESMVANGV